METLYSIHRSTTELSPCVLLSDTDGVIPDDSILIPRLWWSPREGNSCGVNSMSSDIGRRRCRGCRGNRVL